MSEVKPSKAGLPPEIDPNTGKPWVRCLGCDQPMLPKGVKKLPNEYDHTRGCPRTFSGVRASTVAKMGPVEVAALRKHLWESMKGCQCRALKQAREGCTKKIMRCPGRIERWFKDLKRLGLKSPRDKR